MPEITDYDAFLEEDLSWLDLDEIPKDIINPFDKYDFKDDPANSTIQAMCDTDYLHFAAKQILNIDLFPFQLVMLKVLWEKKLPLIVASRGASKTFMLAVYTLLRMIFTPGCRVVIVGAGFRQSKNLFEKMTDIWAEAPVLQDIVGTSKKTGFKQSVDRVEFKIGKSIAIGLPVGSGETIRGLRATHIISDEFASISEDIFNIVVQGFGIVSPDPVQRSKERSLLNKLKKDGVWDEKLQEMFEKSMGGNQIVRAGTAFYAWNHFAKTFHKFSTIIKSKGNPDVLKEVFGSDLSQEEGWNWKDHAVLRIPYTHLPKAFLDEGIVAQNKLTMTTSQFLMEVGACVAPSTKIITSKGEKSIKDIKVGDKVLTHKGRFRKVTQLHKRKVDEILEFSFLGREDRLFITRDHMVWRGFDHWKAAKYVHDCFYLARPVPKDFPDSTVSFRTCIVSRQRSMPYKGYVYNLEVKDDNSYSTSFGTVHNCFPSDSDGFFKRSVIESCTTTKPLYTPMGKRVQFTALRYGMGNREYVIGVDPARSEDNAAIVVLEVHPDHRRLVYCWSLNKKKFSKLRERHIATEQDYYKYLARKIRDLTLAFPTTAIMIDSQGGGAAVLEALGDKTTCKEGEEPLLEIIEEGKDKASDFIEGRHIIHLVSPTNDYNRESNYGMLKDLEMKALLFPAFDSIELARMIELDNHNDIIIDTYEDMVDEIEELKNEMTSIVVSATATGKERFDTPDRISNSAISRSGNFSMKKDRYSALLYANRYCRDQIFHSTDTSVLNNYQGIGTSNKEFVSKLKPDLSDQLYQFTKPKQFKNKEWLTSR